MIDHVYVCIDDRIVGEVYFTARGGRLVSSTFHYRPEYLASAEAWEIDPSLRLYAGAQHVAGLPGVFQDCSPDRWGRNLITKQARATARAGRLTPPTLTDADLLLGVSDVTRQGALRFRTALDGDFLAPGSQVPKLVELPHLLRAADMVSRDDDLAAIKLLLEAGTGSLGGARPKASVRDDERLLIAKFPHADDEWDVVAWEKTALDLAERASIRVPPRRLTRFQGRSVLLVERFDRRGSARVPYLSAMTLLEAHDGDTHDYTEIAETLAAVSTAATDDLHELWRRAAFSVLINNTDDHLRNHGFLREGGGWRLCPAFDLNPNPDPAVARQTAMGGADDRAGALDALMSYAREFRLDQKAATAALASVAGAVETWRDVAASNGIRPGEIARFTDAIRLP